MMGKSPDFILLYNLFILSSSGVSASKRITFLFGKRDFSSDSRNFVPIPLCSMLAFLQFGQEVGRRFLRPQVWQSNERLLECRTIGKKQSGQRACQPHFSQRVSEADPRRL